MACPVWRSNVSGRIRTRSREDRLLWHVAEEKNLVFTVL